MRGAEFDEEQLFRAMGAAEHSEAPVSLEKAAERLALPPTDAEVEDFAALAGWFCRRYPTARERLAFVRHKYAEWTASDPRRKCGEHSTPRNARVPWALPLTA